MRHLAPLPLSLLVLTRLDQGSLYVVSSNTPPLPSYLFRLVPTDPMMTVCGKASEAL